MNAFVLKFGSVPQKSPPPPPPPNKDALVQDTVYIRVRASLYSLGLVISSSGLPGIISAHVHHLYS